MNYSQLLVPVRLAALGFLAQLALSPRLWFPGGGRLFPVLPMFEGMDWGIWPGVGLVLGLLGLLFLPENKWLRAATLGLIGLAVLTDLSRLQVWVWFYFLVILGGSRQDAKTQSLDRQNFAPLRLGVTPWILVAVYLWSGFHKLSPYFVDDVFPTFCQTFDWLKPLGKIRPLGYAAALLEMGIGLALLWPKTRRFGVWAALIFHGYIVYTLFKMHYNLVVVPWNLVMPLLVWLEFGRGGGKAGADLSTFKKLTNLSLAAGLALFAPVLNFWDCWPENLSWKMYAGTHPEATFYFSNSLKIKLPKEVAQYVYGNPERRHLQLDAWTMFELGVPSALTKNYFDKAEKCFCNVVENRDSAGMFLLKVNPWDKSKEQMWRIPCDGQPSPWTPKK